MKIPVNAEHPGLRGVAGGGDDELAIADSSGDERQGVERRGDEIDIGGCDIESLAQLAAGEGGRGVGVFNLDAKDALGGGDRLFGGDLDHLDVWRDAEEVEQILALLLVVAGAQGDRRRAKFVDGTTVVDQREEEKGKEEKERSEGACARTRDRGRMLVKEHAWRSRGSRRMGALERAANQFGSTGTAIAMVPCHGRGWSDPKVLTWANRVNREVAIGRVWAAPGPAVGPGRSALRE